MEGTEMTTETVHAPRDARRDRESNTTKRRKEYYLRVLAVQTALCILLTGGAAVLKKLNADAFDRFRTLYQQQMAADGNPIGTAVKQFFQEEIAVHAAAMGAYAPAQEDADSFAETLKKETVKNSLGRSIRIVRAENVTAAALGITTPAVMPVQGRVSSPFGERKHPINGVRSFHAGLDLAASAGTEIVAAFDGVVLAAGKDSSFGNYIILSHGGGIKTVYAHCKELKASEGDAVCAGDTIALVGSTGQSTGPHLHFELRVGEENIRIDPTVILDV